MKVEHLPLPGLLIIAPKAVADVRGYFLESWNSQRYCDIGVNYDFPQEDVSVSYRNVLRGLHYKKLRPQGQLVTVVHGEIYGVCVDLRRRSPHFGQWLGVTLAAEPARQLWMPPGFAHGFCVMSEMAVVHSKCTETYRPEDEGGIQWNDPDLGIEWPIAEPIVSARDRAFPRLRWLRPEDMG